MFGRIKDMDNRIRLEFIGLLTILAVALCILIIVQLINQKSLINKNNDYANQIIQYNNDIKNNMNKLNAEYADKSLRGILSNNDLYSITNNCWSYELDVNSVKVDSNSINVNSPDGKLDIILKETESDTALPQSILSLGSLTRGDANDNVFLHFTILNKVYAKYTSTEGRTNIYRLEITNINKGETMKISLSDQLQEKLKFNTDIIEVTSK